MSMKIQKKHKSVQVALNSDCTIIDAEADADKLRSLCDDMTACAIDASEVTEIDTAYLQLLLSLKTTAEAANIAFELRNVSSEFQSALEIYGLKTQI